MKKMKRKERSMTKIQYAQRWAHKTFWIFIFHTHMNSEFRWTLRLRFSQRRETGIKSRIFRLKKKEEINMCLFCFIRFVLGEVWHERPYANILMGPKSERKRRKKILVDVLILGYKLGAFVFKYSTFYHRLYLWLDEYIGISTKE